MEAFKNFIKKVKLQSLFMAIALIVIGILFIVAPANSVRIICYVAGAVMLVWGAAKIVYFFVAGIREPGSFSLAGGVALIAFGVLLFVKPDLIAGIFTVLFGILLIVDSVVRLQEAVDLAKLKVKGWWLAAIVAAATLVLGCIIAFDPFSSAQALMIFAGVSLIIDGVIDILSVIYYSAKVEKLKKGIKDNVIDVD